MKKTILILLAGCGTMLFSCNKSNSGDSSSSSSGETKTNEILPRGEGHFLMYYYPTHGIYEAASGKAFTRKDTCLGFPSYITSDAGGMLYSSRSGKKVSIGRSADGGKTWNDVPSNDPEHENYASYAIVAGASQTVYALSSDGSFYVTKDGGSNWEKRTSPCKKDTIHSSPATGLEAWLAVSADGKKLLAQAWYFEEAILAVSEDEGKTWNDIAPPTERNSSCGIGFCGNTIMYASNDQVFTTSDNGKTWINSTPDKMLAPNCQSSFYSYRHFVTDGDKFVVGVEAPSADDSRDENNKYPGAVFLSTDGGKTFTVNPFPYSTDPTPNTSDEYVYLTFVPKK